MTIIRLLSGTHSASLCVHALTFGPRQNQAHACAQLQCDEDACIREFLVNDTHANLRLTFVWNFLTDIIAASAPHHDL